MLILLRCIKHQAKPKHLLPYHNASSKSKYIDIIVYNIKMGNKLKKK